MPRRNLFATAMIGAISLLCWQSSQGAKPKDEMYELYGLFADAVERVEANYVRPVSRRELFESALRGMLQDLDPHSTYISESEWRQFKKTIEGSFIGIGIQVGFDERARRLKVIAPVVGSPAYEAGVLAGDIITEIDGKSTEGLMPDKAVEVLQGKQGTPVKLTVVHPGAEKPETLTMNRAVIDMPSVLGDRRKDDGSWDFLIDKDKKVGYVRVTSFSQNTTEELKKVLDELKTDGMKALVLDLRDNPGGLLSAAVEVSDLFIEDGDIVSTKGRNVRDKVYKARKEETYTGFPMVVLINQHSASAAEIVSACLQDYHRAAIVGQRSYGKGSVQNIIPLEDNQSVLKLTTQTYWRPSGKNIHRFKNAKESDEWGVSPDKGLIVKLTDDEYVAWADARRDRDLFARRKDPKANDKEKPAPDDRQLKKALEVALAKLDGEKPTK
ncbi:MAG TPA: S41 family peptidase [Isosphaeraceae bacterium]|jgi:carboxyl-terminal processing protease|nr:S41 family peptidase [Isosphaeraceae bacterium]